MRSHWIAFALLPALWACGGDDWSTVIGQPDSGTLADGGGGGGGNDPGPVQPPPLCQLVLECPSTIVDEPKTDCRLSVHHGDGALNYDGPAGVEIRGRSSRDYPKKNYALELRDGSGMEQPANLLGMGRESDWVLDGSWIDRSFLRNPVAFDLYRSLGGPERYAARSRFCELTLDGDAVGIYRLTERIKRDDDRVAISQDDGTGNSFVIKQDDGGAVRWDIGEQASWRLVYPRQELATDEQVQGIQRFLDALDAAVHAADPGDPTAGIFAHVDIDAMADWVLVEELAKNIDAYNLSVHLWRDAGGLAHPVPWDFDLSMGQPLADDFADNDLPQGWARRNSSLVEAMATVPAFQQRLASRWREHRAAGWSDAAIGARIDAYLETLAPAAIEANFARWPLQDVDFRQIYRPYGLYPIDSYADEVARLRQWLQQRTAWLDANVEGYVDGNGR